MVVRSPPWLLHRGDVLDVLRTFDANRFDAVLTDPPYGVNLLFNDWDHGVPGVEIWREVLRVMKPGAHLLAFGGPRTFHRLGCAVEDAGFEIRDSLEWLYGSGYSGKSADVEKKLAGRPSAKRWSGYGTLLKPAHESILLARKPMDGLLAKNVERWGTGALAIDACRLEGPSTGRVPSNVILSEDAAKTIDGQSGWTRSYQGKPRSGVNGKGWYARHTGAEYADEGGASRFMYVMKPTRAEWSHGAADSERQPGVKPIRLTTYLARLVLPPKSRKTRRILVPYAGSGSEMIGALRAGWDDVEGIEANAASVRTSRARIRAVLEQRTEARVR